MNIVYIILIVIVLLFLIYLFFNITHYKLNNYFIKIELVEEKINTILDNKLDNIMKIDTIIKEKIKTEKEIIDDLSTLKNEDKSKSEIDTALSDALTKIEYIKDQYDELENEEELNTLFDTVNKDDESLNAYKKYYDENVNKYNNLISKFPYSITAGIFKYKVKKLFEFIPEE